MSDYGDLKPYIKEGIVHTVTQGLSNRVASRSIEVNIGCLIECMKKMKTTVMT